MAIGKSLSSTSVEEKLRAQLMNANASIKKLQATLKKANLSSKRTKAKKAVAAKKAKKSAIVKRRTKAHQPPGHGGGVL